jgi:fucose 4-O-acetylase-like acetyltransferase
LKAGDYHLPCYRCKPIGKYLLSICYSFLLCRVLCKEVFKKCKNIMLGLLAILFFVVALINEPVDMSTMQYGNILLYIISSVSGSYLLVQICIRLCSIRLFVSIERLGRNFVIVLRLHFFVIEILRLLDSKLLGNVLPRLGLAEGIVLGGIVTIIIYSVIPICNCYFGFIFEK